VGLEKLSSRAIIGRFFETLALSQGASWVPLISTEPISSDQEEESYEWLGMTPAMREWIGGRQPKGLLQSEYRLKNKDFEATLEILTKDLRRDKTGQIMLRVDELADRAQAHWASLLSTLIVNGEATLCYDGQYFFSTSHSEGASGTQDNDIRIDISGLPTGTHGSITKPSAGEMSLCILKAIETILGFKDDQGEPYNEMAQQFLVMAAPSLMGPLMAACGNQFVASGEENTLVNADGREFKVRPVVNARLSTLTSKIAVFRTDGRVKPFICQEEVPLGIEAIAEGSELEFKEKKHWYGVSATRNAGYGLWQHACLVEMY
jgi:phage major head subunit gpT-like protein